MVMRGDERVQDGMFSYVSLEQRVPADHPLREVRRVTDTVLRSLSSEFDALYAESGRPSIAPEYILRALLLQVFFSVRSERLLSGGVRYLADLLSEFHGDMRLAVAAYYCGSRNVLQRGLSYSNRDVVTYVQSVRRRYRRNLLNHASQVASGPEGGY